jgi:hypothetical protein
VNATLHPCRCSTQWTGVAPAYGLSAYAIRHGGTEYPLDPSDFCRCLHVSPFAPEHMRDRSPEWTALVDHWDELSDMLREEHSTGTAPRTYARMKALFAEANS